MIISTHKNQITAIQKATTQAKEEAAHLGEAATAVVLLVNGGTLTIRATTGGQVRRSIEPGWEKTGHVNVSRKIADMVY